MKIRDITQLLYSLVERISDRVRRSLITEASALYHKAHSLTFFRERIERPLLFLCGAAARGYHKFRSRHEKAFRRAGLYFLRIKGLYRFKFIRIIFYCAVSCFIVFMISAIMLPSPVFKEPYSSVLLSKEGELLAARIAGDHQWRFPLSPRLPYKYRTALVAFEDRRFYYHPGIDPAALARAIYLNIKKGKIVSGGSTISMQVMRLALGSGERSFFRKTREMFLTLGLEFLYSKDEIMALYATHAPFGGNVVGFETAAWRYFGRSPDSLSWAECAAIAVLPNNPAFMHPGKNREILKKKRDFLLKRLFETGYLPEMDYNLSLKEPLPLRPYPLPRKAPHLLDTLAEKKGDMYFFRSTVRLDAQERTAGIVDRYSRRYSLSGIKNMAVLVIDNKKSEVISYIGNCEQSRSGTMDDDNGKDIDMIQRPRSTGSILKPALYAAMLKDGEIGPSTMIPDIPMHYGGYVPENFDEQYRGVVSAKEALTRSLNVPAVFMLKQYELHRFYHLLKDLGMTTLHRPADEYGLSLILGGAEGKLFELAGIYAALSQIAESGRARTVKILADDVPEERRLGNLSRGPAYLTMQAMLEVVRPDLEGYWRAFSSSQKIGWKTGTSYGQRDAWAIGCTPLYTVGVWVGNADGEGKPGLLGVTYAAPVMFEVFSILDKSKWFDVPLEDLRPAEVCSKSGFIATELCHAGTELIPRHSYFSDLCPYHRLVHLDKPGKWQVNSACESTGSMLHLSWFVLPPVQEFYYRKGNPGYKKLLPMRPDCARVIDPASRRMMSLIYPPPGTKIYIPVGLEGAKSEAVFKAAHREGEVIIFWHLDETYLGSTKLFHQMSVRPDPGRHILTLVDEHGNRIEEEFEVLGKE